MPRRMHVGARADPSISWPIVLSHTWSSQAWDPLGYHWTNICSPFLFFFTFFPLRPHGLLTTCEAPCQVPKAAFLPSTPWVSVAAVEPGGGACRLGACADYTYISLLFHQMTILFFQFLRPSPWSHFWLLSFSYKPHVFHQKILSILPFKIYPESKAFFPCPWSPPGPSYHRPVLWPWPPRGLPAPTHAHLQSILQ